MRIFLLFIIIFLSFHSFSQETYTETVNKNSLPVALADYHAYGFIDGKRLDSIDAIYATFDWLTIRQVTFDYGQNNARPKEYFLTDATGKPLIFSVHSFAFLLNFFHYNHWEYDSNYNLSGIPKWILKKQQ